MSIYDPDSPVSEARRRLRRLDDVQDIVTFFSTGIWSEDAVKNTFHPHRTYTSTSAPFSSVNVLFWTVTILNDPPIMISDEHARACGCWFVGELLLLTIPESIWSENQAQEQRSESIGRLCTELEALAVNSVPLSRRLNHAADIEARSKDLFYNGVTPNAQLSSHHQPPDLPSAQIVDTASADDQASAVLILNPRALSPPGIGRREPFTQNDDYDGNYGDNYDDFGDPFDNAYMDPTHSRAGSPTPFEASAIPSKVQHTVPLGIQSTTREGTARCDTCIGADIACQSALSSALTCAACQRKKVRCSLGSPRRSIRSAGLVDAATIAREVADYIVEDYPNDHSIHSIVWEVVNKIDRFLQLNPGMSSGTLLVVGPVPQAVRSPSPLPAEDRSKRIAWAKNRASDDKARAAAQAGTHIIVDPMFCCVQCRDRGRICAKSLHGWAERCTACGTRKCEWTGILLEADLLVRSLQLLEGLGEIAVYRDEISKKVISTDPDSADDSDHRIGSRLETVKEDLRAFYWEYSDRFAKPREFAAPTRT